MSKREKTDATLRDWLGDEVKGLPPAELVAELDALYTVGPRAGAVEAAQRALAERLEGELPATIYYDVIEDTDFGPIYLATGPKGLVSVDFGVSADDFLAYVQNATGARPQHDPGEVARCSAEIREYVQGEREEMDLAVDLSALTEFQRRGLKKPAGCRGQVATYGEIAERIGKPKASRAVGQALRRNPVPIVVPCHRVVNSNGTLGGYGGKLGSRRKIELLRLEGVVFA